MVESSTDFIALLKCIWLQICLDLVESFFCYFFNACDWYLVESYFYYSHNARELFLTFYVAGALGSPVLESLALLFI